MNMLVVFVCFDFEIYGAVVIKLLLWILVGSCEDLLKSTLFWSWNDRVGLQLLHFVLGKFILPVGKTHLWDKASSCTDVAGTSARAWATAACARVRGGSTPRGRAARRQPEGQGGTPVGSTRRGGKLRGARARRPPFPPPSSRRSSCRGDRRSCSHLEIGE